MLLVGSLPLLWPRWPRLGAPPRFGSSSALLRRSPSIWVLGLPPCFPRIVSVLRTKPGAPPRPWTQTSAVLLLGPIPWPRQCSLVVFLDPGVAPVGSLPRSSALAVLPFLGVGLGSAPIPCRPRPRWWSSSVPRRRLGGPPRPHLGAPHETFGPASVLRMKPSASAWWCSSSAPCLRLGAPHETFGLASAVLLLGSSESLLSVRFGLIVECRVISKNTSDSHLHSSLFILSFLLFLLSFYRCVFSILHSIATKY